MISALYALALVVLVVYGVHLGVLAWARVRRPMGAWPVEAWPAGDGDATEPEGGWPVVTVQLPLYNEAAVARRLIDAVAALDYPRARLEVQVLDDSTDETTALVAERVAHWRARGLDIVHVRRPARTGYKAGALQNGLRLARGDYLALFDADFVPPPGFLRRILPRFDAPDVGLVQARWAHLNADDSLLTQMQAFGLDAHFAVEQAGRQAAGAFVHFNGTAGVWRRACIEAAGGWEGDTLTEDLDLSYRAQLAGWRLRYAHDVEVPAELPASLDALRAQQHRWTKGAAETARKLLGALWRSDQPLRRKLLGTLHLTAHLAFPFTLLAALTHAPLLWLKAAGAGPGSLYFAAASLGLVGLAGFVLAQVLAQRDLYPDWPRRLLRLPVFMAGHMGLALGNTRAMLLGLWGTRSAFVRTPKSGGGGPWWRGRYAAARLKPIAWVEAALAAYCWAGLVGVVAWGEWAAVPFQVAFASGFTLLAAASVQQARQVRRAARAA